MRLRRILFLAAAAWAGMIYYNKYHAIQGLAGSGGILSATSQPSALSRDRYQPIGKVGGLGNVGTDSRSALSTMSSFGSAPVHSNAPVDSHEIFLFMQTAAKGDKSEIEKILADKINVDSRDDRKRTALMYAAWNDHGDICSLLLSAGANVRARDENNQSAFDYAAGRGLSDIVQILLTGNGNKDDNHHLEYASVIRATLADDPGQMPGGKDMLASINRIAPEGHSPLHIAAAGGALGIAEALLKRGARVNLENREQQTPLHWAAWSNQPDMIEWLIKHGADARRRDRDGNTPLILAARNKSARAAEVLLKRGADRTVANKEGKTALMIAEEMHAHALVALLK